MNSPAKPAGASVRKGIDLTKGPIGKHMIHLGTFLAFGTVAIFCTSMVDVYFVSKLGPRALAALSFTFPIYLIVTSVSTGLGTGIVAVISRAVGAGDQNLSRALGTDALVFAVTTGLLLGLIGYLTIDPLFRLLGADGSIMPAIKGYMRIWYPGVVLVMIPQVSQTIARAHGEARYPSYFMWTMSVVNMLLDPLFIFGWRSIPAFGLTGAAIAAVISRVVYLVMMMWLLNARLRALAPVSLAVSRLRESWGKLLYIGVPAMATQMVQPLSNAILTRIIAGAGAFAVAAFGVGSRIEMFTAIYLWAVAGALPALIGQNMGAGHVERVRASVSIAIKFCLITGVALIALVMLFGERVVDIFADSPDVRSLALYYIRMVALSYPLAGLVIIGSQAMNALKRPLEAAVLSIGRAIAITVPFALVGQWLGQVHGVFVGISAAGAVCGAATWVMLTIIVRQETQRPLPVPGIRSVGTAG